MGLMNELAQNCNPMYFALQSTSWLSGVVKLHKALAKIDWIRDRMLRGVSAGEAAVVQFYYRDPR